MKIEELPERLTDDLVRELRKMADSQSDEWKELFWAMSFQQRMDYGNIKGEQQIAESKAKRAKWTFEEWKHHEFTMSNFIASNGDGVVEEMELPIKINKRLEAIGEEKFTFFWETESPFSQWHPSTFTAPCYMWQTEFYDQLLKIGFPENYTFSSAEQYMMYAKAMTFVDIDTAKAIMAEQDPRKIKALGRQVNRFVEDTWLFYRYRIVYLANTFKFTQNEQLLEALFATQGTTLVEASPYDRIWGIGLAKEDEKAQRRITWEGKNLLGEILTELRIELMGHY
ncbi:MAG: hypothetical protein KIPDCIKN_03242 [Haliscomenobacter sp.]|jgi:ribA/ribD-fused uncharacterized protein|nr:hypothetical protein [Haliscomenobacter sp.]